MSYRENCLYMARKAVVGLVLFCVTFAPCSAFRGQAQSKSSAGPPSMAETLLYVKGQIVSTCTPDHFKEDELWPVMAQACTWEDVYLDRADYNSLVLQYDYRYQNSNDPTNHQEVALNVRIPLDEINLYKSGHIPDGKNSKVVLYTRWAAPDIKVSETLHYVDSWNVNDSTKNFNISSVVLTCSDPAIAARIMRAIGHAVHLKLAKVPQTFKDPFAQ
jgi:hypothetical protein